MQGFPSWLEIDLDAVSHNLEQVRGRVRVDVIPCVKTNAYGHGLKSTYCPDCGEFTPLSSFGVEDLEEDIIIVEMRSLERGRGFEVVSRQSALDDARTPMRTFSEHTVPGRHPS